MKKIIIEPDGQTFDPNDYESKLSSIKTKLQEEVLAPAQAQAESCEESGGKYKMFISPALVSAKMYECLMVYKPFNLSEIQQLDEKDLISARNCFIRLTSYLLDICPVFTPDKAMFCAFLNTTVDVYDNLLNNGNSIIISINSVLISQNFQTSSSGIAKEKSIITKLQSKTDGFGLVKNPEVVNNTINVGIDRNNINEKLDRWLNNQRLDKPKK
ncbi:MAG: hypothetical protein EOL97_09750 [Spirochaetia bacterium]|nr:hypothetical protein [Spirochaetia bacterium]